LRSGESASAPGRWRLARTPWARAHRSTRESRSGRRRCRRPRDEAGLQRVAARRMRSVTVAGEVAQHVVSLPAGSQTALRREMLHQLGHHVGRSSFSGKRLATTSPTRWRVQVTSEIWPMANAMVSTVRPKASATPAKPMPSPGICSREYRGAATSEDQPEVRTFQRCSVLIRTYADLLLSKKIVLMPACSADWRMLSRDA